MGNNSIIIIMIRTIFLIFFFFLRILTSKLHVRVLKQYTYTSFRRQFIHQNLQLLSPVCRGRRRHFPLLHSDYYSVHLKRVSAVMNPRAKTFRESLFSRCSNQKRPPSRVTRRDSIKINMA